MIRFKSQKTIKRRTSEHYVYSLVCPITKKVKYIGITCCVTNRYNSHMSDKKNIYKYNWITELKKIGLKPVINIISICENKSKARIIEKNLIGKNKNLLNISLNN